MGGGSSRPPESVGPSSASSPCSATLRSAACTTPASSSASALWPVSAEGGRDRRLHLCACVVQRLFHHTNLLTRGQVGSAQLPCLLGLPPPVAVLAPVHGFGKRWRCMHARTAGDAAASGSRRAAGGYCMTVLLRTRERAAATQPRVTVEMGRPTRGVHEVVVEEVWPLCSPWLLQGRHPRPGEDPGRVAHLCDLLGGVAREVGGGETLCRGLRLPKEGRGARRATCTMACMQPPKSATPACIRRRTATPLLLLHTKDVHAGGPPHLEGRQVCLHVPVRSVAQRRRRHVVILRPGRERPPSVRRRLSTGPQDPPTAAAANSLHRPCGSTWCERLPPSPTTVQRPGGTPHQHYEFRGLINDKYHANNCVCKELARNLKGTPAGTNLSYCSELRLGRAVEEPARLAVAVRKVPGPVVQLRRQLGGSSE